MSVFIVTAKKDINSHFTVKKGMNVEVISNHSNPMSVNSGREIIEEFRKKYGVEISGVMNSCYFDIKKIS